MATKVNLADRLVAQPVSRSGPRQSENDSAAGQKGFASVLHDAARAQDVSRPASEIRSAAAKAPELDRSGKKEREKRSEEKSTAGPEGASADASPAQAPEDDASKQAKSADDASNADSAKATDDTSKEGAQERDTGSADASKVIVPLVQEQAATVAEAVKGKVTADGKKEAAREAGMLPEMPGKAQVAKDGKGSPKGQSEEKPAEDVIKPVKAEPPVAKETKRQPTEEADATAGADRVVKPGDIAAAAAIAEISAGREEIPAALPRALEVKEESPRPAGSSTVLQGLVEGNAGGATQSAGTAAAAQEPPRSGSEQTFDQIVLGLRTKLDANNQQAQIVLNPPNLGRLRVSVEVSNGQLTAQFHATTEVVRDLLNSNMDRLRSVLEGQGITVDKLAVSSGSTPDQVASTNSSGLANQSHDGRSGGAFAQDRQASRQQRGETFGRIWREVRGQEEPIDLLA